MNTETTPDAGPRCYRLHGLPPRFFGHLVFTISQGRVGAIEEPCVPDSLRFLLIVALLGGSVYGVVWALAQYPPEQTEIVKSLPHERLRQVTK